MYNLPKQLVFTNIHHTDFNTINKGLYLALLKAKKTPPHIALISEGMYFDLQVKRKNVNYPLSQIWKSVTEKKIPCVFIKLNTDKKVNDTITNAFSFFGDKLINSETCLLPVKKSLEAVFQFDLSNCPTLLFLVPKLIQERVVSGYYGVNLNKEELESFTIPVYGIENISNRIEELKNNAKK